MDDSWLDLVATAAPYAIGCAMLLDDPNCARLTEAEQVAAVGDALADGAAVADALHARHGSLAPDALAARLGVRIESSDEPAQLGPLWRLADYRDRPSPCITLYRDGLAILAAAPPATARHLDGNDPRQILIAHELYHHVEATRPEAPVSRRWPVTLLKLGRWRWRSGLPVLAEIAAGACAQALLPMRLHPHLLDLMVLEAVGGRAAAIRAAARIAAPAEAAPRRELPEQAPA